MPPHKNIPGGKTITYKGNKFLIITKPRDIKIWKHVAHGTWKNISREHPHYAALRRKGVKAVNERQGQMGNITDKTITMSFKQAAALNEPKPGFAKPRMARTGETFQDRREANRGITARREPRPKELDPHAFQKAIRTVTGKTTLWGKLNWKQQKQVLDFLKKEGYDVKEFEKTRKRKSNKRELRREDIESAILKETGIEVSRENFQSLDPKTKRAIIQYLKKQQFDVSGLQER